MNKTPNFASKESFQRMNYLLQLSKLANETGSKHLANAYSNLTIAISKKAVLRLDPEIKRTICKACHQYLVPGETCSVRIRKKTLVYKCLLCSKQKRFLCTPGYKVWTHNPESGAKIIDCRKNVDENKGNSA